jgi:hypothetical protein
MLIGIAVVALVVVGWYTFAYYQKTRVARGKVPATKLERQVRIMLSTPVGRDEDAVAKLFSEYEYSLRLRQQRLMAEGSARNAPELAIINQLYEQFPKWCADATVAAMTARMNRIRF